MTVIQRVASIAVLLALCAMTAPVARAEVSEWSRRRCSRTRRSVRWTARARFSALARRRCLDVGSRWMTTRTRFGRRQALEAFVVVAATLARSSHRCIEHPRR